MDELIEKYKQELINDDNAGYGYPGGLKDRIIKYVRSNDFAIHVEKVQKMIKCVRKEYADKEFSRIDMIHFAEYVYNQIADLPGHEPDVNTLNEWLASDDKNTRTSKNFNHWIAQLRWLAINKGVFFCEDGEDSRKMTKQEINELFCKKRFKDQFDQGLTPKEAFDAEMEAWADAL